MAQRADRLTNSAVSSSLCLVVGGSSGSAMDGPDQVKFVTRSARIAIGRSAECDLMLTGATVSRLHCVLKQVNSGYIIEDCSRNGTWVNGMRIRTCLLRDGDQVRIGNHQMRVELTTARPTAQAAGRLTGSGHLPHQDRAHDRSGQLRPQIFVRGLEEGVTFSLNGDNTTIGRHPSSDIRLDGEKVSRDHSLIRRAGLSFVLVDAGSVNGTYVNGQRIERVGLADGDRVSIGDYDCLVSFRDQDCILQFRKRAN